MTNAAAFPHEFHPRADGLPGCELCQQPGGHGVWADAEWRVIRAQDAAFPAFYRVVFQQHVAEFSQLDPQRRRRAMDLVCAVELVLIARLQPTKVNLASLGNVVPHLHWHVIARFDWDSHFPQPIWGAVQREVEGGALGRLACSLDELDAAVASALGAVAS